MTGDSLIDGRTMRAMRAVVAWYARVRPDLADEFESYACLRLVQSARRFTAHAPEDWYYFAVSVVRLACRNVIATSGALGYRTAADKADAPAVGALPEGTVSGEPCGPESGELPVGWELESEDGVRSLAARLPARHRARVLRGFLDCRTPGLVAVLRADGYEARNMVGATLREARKRLGVLS